MTELTSSLLLVLAVAKLADASCSGWCTDTMASLGRRPQLRQHWQRQQQRQQRGQPSFPSAERQQAGAAPQVLEEGPEGTEAPGEE